MSASPSQEPLCFPALCCTASFLNNTSSPGRYMRPEGWWSWFYFIQCEFYALLIGARNFIRVGILSARSQCVTPHYWSAIKCKLLESAPLLGIDPSVCACVCTPVCDQISAAQGVDLQRASWVYFRPISHTDTHTHTRSHSWVWKVRSLSLWHFHLTRSPRALTFTSMFPVPHAEAQYQPLNI